MMPFLREGHLIEPYLLWPSKDTFTKADLPSCYTGDPLSLLFAYESSLCRQPPIRLRCFAQPDPAARAHERGRGRLNNPLPDLFGFSPYRGHLKP